MVKRSQNLLMFPVLLLLLMLAAAFRNITGTVGGNVNPPEVALRAFLFSAKDTLSVNIAAGNFQFTKVPSGTYKLLVEAAPPYKNAVKEGLRVIEGEFTDAGQIELTK